VTKMKEVRVLMNGFSKSWTQWGENRASRSVNRINGREIETDRRKWAKMRRYRNGALMCELVRDAGASIGAGRVKGEAGHDGKRIQSERGRE
jgi:hypothetical protein